MSQLIKQLRNEHAELSAALVQIEKLGVTTPEGQELLAGAKAALLGHLEKEDAEMYPTLHKAADQDSALREKLDSYAADMNTVSARVLAFFEKHQGTEKGVDFEADFREVYLALTKRIISEESKLFPEFDRLVSD